MSDPRKSFSLIRALPQLRRQFGIAPSRLLFRLSGQTGPIVLANSMPKSGTNLLLRCLYLMYPLRRKLMRTLVDSDLQNIKTRLSTLHYGDVAAAHLNWSVGLAAELASRNIAHILIVRDPRDVAVSGFNYITYKDHRHRLHHFLRNLKDDSARLLAIIEGIDGDKLADGRASLGLAEHYRGFLEWRRDRRCLLIKFEDLVGLRGGGCVKRQRQTIQDIGAHLSLPLDCATVDRICNQAFHQGGRTFHQGQIGAWKKHFRNEHKKSFKQSFDAILEELGYEGGNDW